MRSIKEAFVCAGWNLYSLRKNPRFYMSLLLGFLLCWLLTDKTMAISRTYLTNVQLFEPFVWCYADDDSILFSALTMMLMFSAFPRLDTPACGKRSLCSRKGIGCCIWCSNLFK